MPKSGVIVLLQSFSTFSLSFLRAIKGINDRYPRRAEKSGEFFALEAEAVASATQRRWLEAIPVSNIPTVSEIGLRMSKSIYC
jgi:hypothetical protein